MRDSKFPVTLSSNYLKLNLLNSVNHYWPTIFISIIPLLLIYSSYSSTNSKTQDNIWPIVFIWFIAIVSFIFQKRSLRFSEIRIQQTNSHFTEAISRIKKQHDWTVINYNKHSAKIFHNALFIGRQMITIIRDDSKICINSIGDPEDYFSAGKWSFGQNKKNVQFFLAKLNDAISGREDQPDLEDDLPKNEWSFKRILIRIIIYPFCLFIIWASLKWLLPNENMGYAFFGIAIAVIYIYSDIKILTNKYHSKNDTKI